MVIETVSSIILCIFLICFDCESWEKKKWVPACRGTRKIEISLASLPVKEDNNDKTGKQQPNFANNNVCGRISSGKVPPFSNILFKISFTMKICFFFFFLGIF